MDWHKDINPLYFNKELKDAIKKSLIKKGYKMRLSRHMDIFRVNLWELTKLPGWPKNIHWSKLSFFLRKLPETRKAFRPMTEEEIHFLADFADVDIKDYQ
jgi:hypothetical protein